MDAKQAPAKERAQLQTMKDAPRPATPLLRSTAKAAGLRYVTDALPGIRRLRTGKGFRYVDEFGRPIHDAGVLTRIRSMAIPPAWTDVWICALENGHLQVTARDARGRKQYRYHALWREVRDQVKYERLATFGRALPAIRDRVAADLALSGLPREKVVALVVQLLEATFMRVGNEKYVRDNGSFGLTTLRNEHVDVMDGCVRFQFRGKSGKRHDVKLSDRRMARIVQRCRDLPGYELFQYLDAQGAPHGISSSDVNDYLRSITGQDYTAKDFRTWAGTVLAAHALQGYEGFESTTQRKKNVVRAIAAVAQQLGNTPSICRKCYVHPRIIDLYLDGTMIPALKRSAASSVLESAGLYSAEVDVLRLLGGRLERTARTTRSRGKVQTRNEATSRSRRWREQRISIDRPLPSS